MLRFAYDNNLRINPTGASTKQPWLNESRAKQTTLDTRNMNAVLEHTWQDLTCTVQPGCTWAFLQSALKQHGQQVALDPLWPARATVGGIIAANDSGTLRLRYGGLRDLLIGMTVVLADGTVARSGGKVVKNVAGYDLPKLFCGSFGTLGVITEITFRLHAIKPNKLTLTLESANAEPLGSLLLRVLASHLSTEAMQLRTTPEAFALDVQLAASPEVLTQQTAQLAALAKEVNLPEPAATNEEVWPSREVLFAPGEQENIVCKLSVVPTNIAATTQAIAAMNGRAVAQATGLITARIPAHQAEALTRLRTQTEAQRGSLVILQMPASCTLSRWGTEPNSLPLMRAVKAQFDPRNVLNAGRFLGGI
jgi:glycolate oxidase FAD binding subunit